MTTALLFVSSDSQIQAAELLRNAWPSGKSTVLTITVAEVVMASQPPPER